MWLSSSSRALLGLRPASERGGGHVTQRLQAHNLSPEQWHGLHWEWLETLADVPQLRGLSVLPGSEVGVDDITWHDTIGHDQVGWIAEEAQVGVGPLGFGHHHFLGVQDQPDTRELWVYQGVVQVVESVEQVQHT